MNADSCSQMTTSCTCAFVKHWAGEPVKKIHLDSVPKFSNRDTQLCCKCAHSRKGEKTEKKPKQNDQIAGI